MIREMNVTDKQTILKKLEKIIVDQETVIKQLEGQSKEEKTKANDENINKTLDKISTCQLNI